MSGSKGKSNTIFVVTVLEVVKLIQVGSAVFGRYGIMSGTSSSCPRINGLLCGETVEGIRWWIGESCVGLEVCRITLLTLQLLLISAQPMERIVNPMFVAALISLIFCARNKLTALGVPHLSRSMQYLFTPSCHMMESSCFIDLTIHCYNYM